MKIKYVVIGVSRYRSGKHCWEAREFENKDDAENTVRDWNQWLSDNGLLDSDIEGFEVDLSNADKVADCSFDKNLKVSYLGAKYELRETQ